MSRTSFIPRSSLSFIRSVSRVTTRQPSQHPTGRIGTADDPCTALASLLLKESENTSDNFTTMGGDDTVTTNCIDHRCQTTLSSYFQLLNYMNFQKKRKQTIFHLVPHDDRSLDAVKTIIEHIHTPLDVVYLPKTVRIVALGHHLDSSAYAPQSDCITLVVDTTAAVDTGVNRMFVTLCYVHELVHRIDTYLRASDVGGAYECSRDKFLKKMLELKVSSSTEYYVFHVQKDSTTQCTEYPELVPVCFEQYLSMHVQHDPASDTQRAPLIQNRTHVKLFFKQTPVFKLLRDHVIHYLRLEQFKRIDIQLAEDNQRMKSAQVVAGFSWTLRPLLECFNVPLTPRFAPGQIAHGIQVLIQMCKLKSVKPGGGGGRRPTVPELRRRAKSAGIVGYSRMRKADLVAALDNTARRRTQRGPLAGKN